MTQWCAKRASAVVVMSAEMDRHLDADAAVIPHGVDLDQFRPRNQAAARAELGWADDTVSVLFPAHPARPVKNYPRAERVVAAARDRLSDPVSLETLSDVPHQAVETYMNAADALLLTSHHEGSPNTVKEALACNLPVVSTPVGDVADRLDGVSPSAVCETDDELVGALTRVLRERTRSNGRGAVRELTPERMARRLRAVYDDACSDG
ncbi:glycosyltransferase family 4 protein [Halorubrum sp. AD140]|uniref:glycosyltransferase family 4 protein n=1 Tax=Halorubrum sp. AD140 TaxID=3050073 RepID=UPI002ACC9749|nr:glycosyltransferase family 4 protein [Halorubrum sp. AD140]MDZ5812515.1 glycosyltransferase family 4 protein [Halorubrum sp. AD140]